MGKRNLASTVMLGCLAACVALGSVHAWAIEPEVVKRDSATALEKLRSKSEAAKKLALQALKWESLIVGCHFEAAPCKCQRLLQSILLCLLMRSLEERLGRSLVTGKRQMFCAQDQVGFCEPLRGLAM